MKPFVIPRAPVNIELLDHELRAAIGTAYHAISTSPGLVRVYLAQTADHATLEQVRRIVLVHDETSLSPRQLRRQQRQHLLQAARAAYGDGHVLEDYRESDPLLKRLAETVYWLVLEVKDLHGLID